ncbi:hypothetical protein [Limosilactobacillus oris]|nr:hypothetical protein [Limosilactobacillus oris]
MLEVLQPYYPLFYQLVLAMSIIRGQQPLTLLGGEQSLRFL